MTKTLASILGLALLLAALGAGYILGRAWPSPAGSSPAGGAAASPAGGAAGKLYTCSMHPGVRRSGPGTCPICEMDLTRADAALTLSDHAIAMASVETAVVTRRELSRGLRAVGKIQYDESSLATVTTRVDGYAEKLFVDFTGIDIKAGDHLAEIYSPELLVGQQELLIALQGGGGGLLVETAKLKLRRWGLTDQQIGELVDSKKITDRITLYSPIDGTVIEKIIVENSSFKAGDALYRVANLDTVWAYLDIYEVDVAWVRYGQKVELIAEAYPGRVFTGMVTFVQPVLDEATRTVRVPVHIENTDHALKPGMYASAVIEAKLAADGRAAPTGVEGKFSCPMHPQVLADVAGGCPLCGMPLEQIPAPEAGAPPPGEAPGEAPVEEPVPATRFSCPMECEKGRSYDRIGNCPVCRMKLEEVEPRRSGPGLLAVPATAVLDSGTRKIAYVEKGRGTFEPRELVLGPRAGEYFPVISGLAEGERIVTRGGFLIDSQFQITGHPSLFYPGGLHASMGHQHGPGGEPRDAEGPGAGGAPPEEPGPGEPDRAAVPPVEHRH